MILMMMMIMMTQMINILNQNQRRVVKEDQNLIREVKHLTQIEVERVIIKEVKVLKKINKMIRRVKVKAKVKGKVKNSNFQSQKMMRNII